MSMKLWLSEKGMTYDQDETVRTGLYLRFEPSVDAEVKRAFKEFAVWLRSRFRFPIRLVVYVKAAKRIKAYDGEMVCGTYFGPFDHTEEPYIRLAVGDYDDLCIALGQDNALATLLHGMAHEMTHYYQWLRDMELTEKQEERQAEYYASRIVDMYAETREHP